MSDLLKCQRCGRSVKHLMVCDTCAEELSLEGQARIARTVTACSKSLASMILLCTKVILTGGQDKLSMARALSNRDAINDLDRAINEVYSDAQKERCGES